MSPESILLNEDAPSSREVGELLRHLTVPVMGCTEPAAVALAASLATAAAREIVPDWIHGGPTLPPAILSEEITLEFLQIRTVPSLYKNALAVGLPNAEGGSGIYLSAALGPFLECGSGLNLLKGIQPETLSLARDVLGRNRLSLEVMESGREGVFVEARVIGVFRNERHVGEAVISGEHDQVMLLRRDGKILFERKQSSHKTPFEPILERLAGVSLTTLLNLTASLDAETYAHVLHGVKMNLAAARAGLDGRLGLGVGAAIQEMVDEGILSMDLPTRARCLTASATDARMSGHEVEVMSSSGSGNQGLIAVLPVAAAAQHTNASDELLVQGAALSHLVTAVMTRHAGLLSALCGCVVKAGMGAASGIALVLEMDTTGVFGSLLNMAGNMTGEICDGAKVGCAVKLCTAAAAAVQSALLARKKVVIPATNGILAPSSHELFSNIGKLARAMKEMDRNIVAMMEQKQARGIV